MYQTIHQKWLSENDKWNWNNIPDKISLDITQQHTTSYLIYMTIQFSGALNHFIIIILLMNNLISHVDGLNCSALNDSILARI